jgi:hypothetical protein
VHDDGREVVDAGRVGSTRFWAVVEDELREVQRIDGEIDAQVDFSSGRGESVRESMGSSSTHLV